jgi:TfoX/Sxy family transcriptional regulator of competence genes
MTPPVDSTPCNGHTATTVPERPAPNYPSITVGMSMPKAGEADKDWFRSLVPVAPNVLVRPMFGNLAAFVNGNMFLALFGSRVAVRLAEEDRDALLARRGAGPFEPMPGRPMAEYILLPEAWRAQPTQVATWTGRALAYASAMPGKTPKKK